MLLLALYIVLATINVVAHGLELHMLRATDTQPYGKQKDENCEVAHIMLLILSRINQISWVLYFKETLHKKVALISAGWHWLHCVSKLSVFISLQLFNNLCKSGSDCRQSKASFLWKQVATHQATCAMAFWLKCVHLVLHAWPLGNHSYLQSTVKYIKIQYSYQVTTDFSCLKGSWPPILLYPYWLFAFLLE